MTATNEGCAADPRAVRDRAKAFAIKHARALAAELNEWQDKGRLRDGRLQELAQICAEAVLSPNLICISPPGFSRSASPASAWPR